MKKQILKENKMNCKAECEFYEQCGENKETCIKNVINNELKDKAFKGGCREAIIRCFGLDGKEPWSFVQLAMSLRTSLDEVGHIYARALRILRHPSRSRKIKKFDIWACKYPDSPYSRLIFSIFGICDPEMYLIYTEGVEEEYESSANMSDEEYEKMKRIRRASYKYNYEVRCEGSKRIDFELEELEKGTDILSIFKAEGITLNDTLMNELKALSSNPQLDSNKITELFQMAVQGSLEARDKIIESSKIYALLVCKEYALKPNFLLGFTTNDLINIAYQRLEWTVDVYIKTNKKTFDFKELLATYWIWEGFSKAVHTRYSLIEAI